MIDDFRDVLREFVAHRVTFLVVGAHALAVHGIPRATGDIDIMTSISGVAFEDAWADRVEGTVAEVHVPVLGKTTFLANKRASGRPKDLADLKALGE